MLFLNLVTKQVDSESLLSFIHTTSNGCIFMFGAEFYRILTQLLENNIVICFARIGSMSKFL